MDSGSEMKMILGVETPVAAAGDPADRMLTDYSSELYLDTVRKQEERFAEKQKAFFAHTLREGDALRTAARAWAKAGTLLAGYAGSLFNYDPDNAELRNYAMDLLDKVSKGSLMRTRNLSASLDRLKETELSDIHILDRMENALDLSQAELIRSVNTFARYRGMYERGEVLAASKMEGRKQLAADTEALRNLIPAGTIHMPGRIYPPVPIPPSGDPVPDVPKAYQLYKKQPPEAYEYDEKLDELVLKQGYVSPDGLVDAHSVVPDREHGVVYITLRGSDHTDVWREWKPKTPRDVLEPGSDCWNFWTRYPAQRKAEKEMKMFRKRKYENSG